MKNQSLNASFSPPFNTSALEKKLSLDKKRRAFNNSLLWMSINVVLLTVLLYDLANTCYFYYHWCVRYIETGLVLILAANIIHYCFKVSVLCYTGEQTPITAEQKKLLGISDTDPNFRLVATLPGASNETPMRFSPTRAVSPASVAGATPMNMSAASWRSNLSASQSLNYSMSSPSWVYHKGTSSPRDPQFSPQVDSSFDRIQYRDTSGIDFISNDKELQTFLKDVETNTSLKNFNTQTQQSNLLSSFWSHPIVKSTKDISTFLQKTAYQLSTQTQSTASPLKSTKIEDSPVSLQNSTMIAWSGVNIDIGTLTQWNENLRIWISTTILERLVGEFDQVSESLDKQGLADMKIGSVGLDRLRKTAQIAHVVQSAPTLPMLIPFLEVTPNQEYLVKRMRELAKGGCMSEYRWNGGSGYNGKDWDDSLPTDSVIIMHLLASYLDTQLMPSPNMPDSKPFSGNHYVKYREKMPTLTPNSLLIQQSSEKPPHFRVIVGETACEMVKGYNNLFHSILFFLFNVNRKCLGMLGRVSLGRAGVNMLWIIDQD